MTDRFLELAADIVSAFVSNNSLPADELPHAISAVHASLKGLANGVAPLPVEPQLPAVAIKKSISPDHLVCLEDGKRFKSLKRHLRTAHGLTPEQYREKWKLPPGYPTVAPGYAEKRSALAKSSGLGLLHRRAPEKQG